MRTRKWPGDQYAEADETLGHRPPKSTPSRTVGAKSLYLSSHLNPSVKQMKSQQIQKKQGKMGVDFL